MPAQKYPAYSGVTVAGETNLGGFVFELMKCGFPNLMVREAAYEMGY